MDTIGMSERTDEDPVEQGLRTELILEAIFKFLPMRWLLSCSQVNKLWNYQARLYIRDHRKCTAHITPSSPCSKLKELDEIIGGMSVVPFNSLKIPLAGHPACSQAGPSPVFKLKNLMTKLKLKHLSISSWNPSNLGFKECPATFVLFQLLRYNAGEIKNLSIDNLPSPLLKALVKFQPQLPKLEELDLETVHDSFWEEGAEFLQTITRASPKLKRILHDRDPKILQVLLQNLYHLLRTFDCDDFAQTILNGPEERCMKLAKSGPALTDLDLRICTSSEQTIRNSYEMLQFFLRGGYKSLETLWVIRLCPLYSMITFPPLEGLRWLKLQSFVGSDRFMELIQSIQFGRQFPNLWRMDLESYEIMDDLPTFTRSPQLEDGTEVELVPGSAYSSTSTQLAEISGDVCRISFLRLKQLIPMVTKLCVYPMYNSSHAVPFRQIFRLWPHLRELTVSGGAGMELYNCDAEFCGIDQAEVEDLWLMEETELRNLKIVPRRPCPMTMKSLKLINIVFSLVYNFEALPKERAQKFLSVVTKCLLVERLPSLKLCLRIQRGDDHRTPIFNIND